MNKKFLLSTIASAILLTNNADAVDFNINYTGNNTFTYQETRYDSFQALSTDIRRINNNSDIDINILIPDDEKRILFHDLAANTQGLKTQYADFAASYYQKNLQDIFALLDYSTQVYAQLPADEQYFLLNAIEINDIVRFREKEFTDTVNYVKSNSNTEKIIGQTGTKFTLKALSINDANIQGLIPELRQLFARERDKTITTTAAEKARQKELTKIIFGRSELNSLRNSPENQELLKNYIINLKTGALVNNKYIKDVIIQKTEQLIAYLDIFMVTDVKDASTVPAVQKSDSAVTEGMINSLQATRELVDSRINGFSATAAGDLLQSYGAWVKGSFTEATQNAYKNAPGYKLSQKGVTVGADTGDEILLGVAYSYNQNDIKNTTIKTNKEDIESHTFTAYGKAIVTNDIFLKGQGQFGKSEIKKSRSTGDLANNLAKAKTNANMVAAKLEIGYDYPLSSPVHIIPTIGLSYADIDVKGYTESGIGLNRSVSKRNSNRTSGLAGVSINYDGNASGSIKLMPEMHANIDYAFNTKNSATIVKIFDTIDTIATPAEKLAKAYFNIGASIKAFQFDKYEISTGYDLGLAKKFHSHTGTLKVRVNM